MDQNEEFCFVELNGDKRRIRFHDYAEIYKIPGLYEQLFAELLECRSPEVITDLLRTTLRGFGEDPSSLRVLDFGAGNGMVAERLAQLGANPIIGVDLLPEARMAALRDRPGLYQEYVAADITALDAQQREVLTSAELNCLTCVAALGFDDVPPAAFAAAFNLIQDDGWLAFNLRDRFVDSPGPFSQLLTRLGEEDILSEVGRLRYHHRLSVTGEQLDYVAVIARKHAAIPDALL